MFYCNVFIIKQSIKLIIKIKTPIHVNYSERIVNITCKDANILPYEIVPKSTRAMIVLVLYFDREF